MDFREPQNLDELVKFLLNPDYEEDFSLQIQEWMDALAEVGISYDA